MTAILTESRRESSFCYGTIPNRKSTNKTTIKKRKFFLSSSSCRDIVADDGNYVMPELSVLWNPEELCSWRHVIFPICAHQAIHSRQFSTKFSRPYRLMTCHRKLSRLSLIAFISCSQFVRTETYRTLQKVQIKIAADDPNDTGLC